MLPTSSAVGSDISAVKVDKAYSALLMLSHCPLGRFKGRCPVDKETISGLKQMKSNSAWKLRSMAEATRVGEITPEGVRQGREGGPGRACY